MDKGIRDVFIKRHVAYLGVIGSIVVLYLISAYFTEFSLSEGLLALPDAMGWIFTRLVPNSEAMQKLPKILDKLFETALLSVAVTTVSATVAFGVSLFGSKTLEKGKVINQVVRVVAAFFRNVPDVVWAMLLMFSFGQNILTGFLALFFTTFGMLTRSFIETIDEVSGSCVEALDATGANFLQIVFQGIIPSAVTGIVTWILYMIETNIRSSTLIGMLTATGIGYLFDMYYKRLDFAAASIVIIAIVLLVIVIEMVSNQVRKVIK